MTPCLLGRVNGLILSVSGHQNGSSEILLCPHPGLGSLPQAWVHDMQAGKMSHAGEATAASGKRLLRLRDNFGR